MLDAAFRQMQTRLGEQWRSLTRQDQERRELVANISHDLRTPLASLHGYLETLSLKDASLTPEDLDREIDLTSWGMGMVPLGAFIGAITLANTNWHCGEISLLKGLQGLKGYPG